MSLRQQTARVCIRGLEREVCVGSFEDKGDDIPRTTSRTEVGSAKASRMNSCGIFGSAAFSILAIQRCLAGRATLGETRLQG